MSLEGLSNAIESVGRITPAGQISEFPIPAFKGNPVSVNRMALGSDGSIWFTASTRNGRLLANGLIGRVSTTGQISEFGTPADIIDPTDMALGSDGNIWFDEDSAHAIGRVSTH